MGPSTTGTESQSKNHAKKPKARKRKTKAKSSITAEHMKGLEDDAYMISVIREHELQALYRAAAGLIIDVASKQTDYDGDQLVDENPVITKIITDANFPFEIKPCKNIAKGHGMFATQDINAGTVILCEAPFLSGKSTALRLEAIAASLSAERNQQMLDLMEKCTCKWGPNCRELLLHRVYLNNAIDVGQSTYLYRIVARMNHDCQPNAALSFTKEGVVVVTALCNIKAGEEITRLCVAAWGDRFQRGERLQASFDHYCLCQACRRYKITCKPDNFNPTPTIETAPGPIINLLSTEELAAIEKADTWYRSVQPSLHKISHELDERILLCIIQGRDNELEILGEMVPKWGFAVHAKNEYGFSDETLVELAADRRNRWLDHHMIDNICF